MDLLKDNNDILVSISCITYNHAPYIRQCLDGFLMQRTNFAFEVLIHDDCSTDGTTDIIREYEKKYPDIIKPIYEEENQYQQGKPSGSVVWNFPRARGKYIAMCEGDDYWVDSLKLQKQVDFMEAHLDYSLCFHNYNQLWPDGNIVPISKNMTDPLNCSIKDAILSGGGYMATNSMLFRTKYIENIPLWTTIGAVDFSLMLILFHSGKVVHLDIVGSVYRVNSIGSWSEKMNKISFVLQNTRNSDAILRNFNKWSNKKYHNVILLKRIKNQLITIKLILKIYCRKFFSCLK